MGRGVCEGGWAAGEGPWGTAAVRGGGTSQEYRREESRAVGFCSRREAGVGG